jgi:hypothetical protein
MNVSAWRSGKHGTYGIRVGNQNRKRFFDSRWSEIEVEVEGEMRTFELTAGFWHKCPEFRDRGSPVLREWLRRHHTIDWPKGQPPSFTLTSLGENRFRLVP